MSTPFEWLFQVVQVALHQIKQSAIEDYKDYGPDDPRGRNENNCVTADIIRIAIEWAIENGVDLPELEAELTQRRCGTGWSRTSDERAR
jgi:hypothetical protein